MEIKAILYVLSIPFSIWLLDSININNIFKKNKITQAKIFYLVLAFIMSYLLVNFIYDTFLYTKIV
jgi:uncharacterized integral membrane protein (TIGR02327 family)